MRLLRLKSKESMKQPFNRYETEFQINNGEDPYVALAKASLTTYLKTGKYMKVPSGLPAEMLNRRAGTFVSLKKWGACEAYRYDSAGTIFRCRRDHS